jgi:asparagine synthase (glutamine-hydrolysing)
MSHICGVAYWDGRPAQTDLVISMIQALDFYKGESLAVKAARQIAMGLYNAHPKEQLPEDKRLVSARNEQLMIIADVRLDNREELMSTLASKQRDCLSENPTDCELITAAYLEWGYHCCDHLIGDFAFVIWDEVDKTIYAARDPLGQRVLYYRYTPLSFHWASEAIQILADREVSCEFDEEMIAHELAAPAYSGLDRSYYKEIQRLEAGHYVIANSRQKIVRKYWDLQPEKSILRTDTREYAEEFRELFFKAIRNRLDGNKIVGIFLSGGLDSTSTAAAIAFLMGEGLNISTLESISWGIPDSEFDESPRSRLVADMWQIPQHFLDIQDLVPFQNLEDWKFGQDEPINTPIYPYYIESFARLPRIGTWVTAHNADDVIGGANPFFYLKFLQEQGGRALLRLLREDSRAYGTTIKGILLNFYLLPFLLQPLISIQRHKMPAKQILSEWISEELIRKYHLREWFFNQHRITFRPDQNLKQIGWSEPARNYRYRLIHQPRTQRMQTWFLRMAARSNVKLVNPWVDVRLIEYAVAIPQTIHAKGIRHKLLLREAMAPYLPEQIAHGYRMRAGAPLYQTQMLKSQGFKEKAAAILRQNRAAQKGWIDAKVLNKVIIEILENPQRSMQELWYLLCLEVWLQKFAQHNQYMR